MKIRHILHNSAYPICIKSNNVIVRHNVKTGKRELSRKTVKKQGEESLLEKGEESLLEKGA
jgi:hypothetical protein